jgi:hypothetical protein
VGGELLAAAKGSTTSSTSFDCQISFISVTLHRNPRMARRMAAKRRGRLAVLTVAIPFCPAAPDSRLPDLQSRGKQERTE